MRERHNSTVIEQLLADVAPSVTEDKSSSLEKLKLQMSEVLQGSSGIPVSVEARVNKIYQRLIGSAPYLGEVPPLQIEDCWDYYASFSVFNGLVLCRGAIAYAETEDELAFLMAHELAHSYLNHTISNASKSNINIIGEFATALSAGLASAEIERWLERDDTSERLKERSESMLQLGTELATVPGAYITGRLAGGIYERKGFYHQEQEIVADLLGIDLLMSAGYSPAGATVVLGSLGGEGRGVLKRNVAFNGLEFLQNTRYETIIKKFSPSTIKLYPELMERTEKAIDYIRSHYARVAGKAPKGIPWREEEGFRSFRKAFELADDAMVDVVNVALIRKEHGSIEIGQHICNRAHQKIQEAANVLQSDMPLAIREVALSIECHEYIRPTILVGMYGRGDINQKGLRVLMYYYSIFDNSKEFREEIDKLYNARDEIGHDYSFDIEFYQAVGRRELAMSLLNDCLSQADESYQDQLKSARAMEDAERRFEEIAYLKEERMKEHHRCNNPYEEVRKHIVELGGAKHYAFRSLQREPEMRMIAEEQKRRLQQGDNYSSHLGTANSNKEPQPEGIANSSGKIEKTDSKLTLGRSAVVSKNSKLPYNTTQVDGDSYIVQIAAVRQRQEAESAWFGATLLAPNLFAGRQQNVVRVDLKEKGVWFRVGVAGFLSREAAETFCKSYKSSGGDCLVRKQN